jgi:hypothetical protein
MKIHFILKWNTEGICAWNAFTMARGCSNGGSLAFSDFQGFRARGAG